MIDIKKDLLVRALKHYHDAQFTPGVYEHSIFGQAALLLQMDTVSVVRCKDCKWYELGKEPFCGFSGIFTNEGEYCSYGERKEK